MKRFSLNVLIMYLVIIVYCSIINIFNLDIYPIFSIYINPTIWLLLIVLTLKLLKPDKSRIKDKGGKKQTLFIFSIFYLIIYFLLGLLFGFEYSPYSHKLIGIIKNIFSIVLVIIFQEKLRCILINYIGNKKKYFILLTILFIIINLNFSLAMLSFSSFETLFKYFFETFMVTCISQFLYTFFAKTCGFVPLLLFRLPIEISFLLVPVFPRLDWFIYSIFHLIIYTIFYFVLKYEYSEKENRISANKPSNPLLYVPLIILIIVFVSFVMGAFKYRPVAIVSNSMVPVFERGDIAIIKKIKNKDIPKLHINDIIEYRIDNYVVIHRITKIEEQNGIYYFQTKGDNNNAPDTKYVSQNQVIGVVKYIIPKLGYPTVWLSDLFKKNNKVSVEMGNN